VLIEIYVIK